MLRYSAQGEFGEGLRALCMTRAGQLTLVHLLAQKLGSRRWNALLVTISKVYDRPVYSLWCMARTPTVFNATVALAALRRDEQDDG